MRCSYHQDREAVGTCTRCGRGVCEECNVPVNGRNVCKGCIGILAGQMTASHKEPFLALILSFFLPGLGQLYNDDAHKGFYLILLTVIAWILTLGIIGFFIFLGVWAYAMCDAYTTAGKINRGEIVPKR